MVESTNERYSKKLKLSANMSNFLNKMILTEGASPEIITHEEAALVHRLPCDYVDFLKQHNGGEGEVGDNYLIIWRVEELAKFNREYEVKKYAPGLILFASDGGGEGYAFDCRDELMPIVRVPFIGMGLKYAEFISKDFSMFLAALSS